MKRILLVLLICLQMMAMAQKKVAVYVTSDTEGVDNAQREIIGGELVAAIVQTTRYKAVERTADFLQQINKEHGYQHSGNVDDEQISALGKQFGVDYVCVANIIPYRNIYYIQARMIDVETATVQSIARETSSLSSPDELMTASAKVAHALINPDETYKAPVDDNSKKDRYRYAKAATTDKPEGLIVCNTYSERHILGMKEYSYGATQMDRKAYADFLSKNCPNAFIKYYKGKQMVTAGWVLFGVGAAMTVVGWSIFAKSWDIAKKIKGSEPEFPSGHYYYFAYHSSTGVDYYYYYEGGNKVYVSEYEKNSFEKEYEIEKENYYKYQEEFHECSDGLEALSCSIGSIGACATVTSFILLPIGYSYQKKAVDIFNNKCAYKRTTACTFNVQSSRDGIGVALRF